MFRLGDHWTSYAKPPHSRIRILVQPFREGLPAYHIQTEYGCGCTDLFGWSLLAHSQLCHALLALRICELRCLVMLPLQRLLCHVAALPGSAALKFLNVAIFEKNHIQYLVQQCKVGLSHLQKTKPCLGLVFSSLIKDTCSTL